MPLKIRQKKEKKQPVIAQHSSYTSKGGRHWQEQYREDNNQKVRKSFVALVAIMIAIVVILILSAVTTFVTQANNASQITAADTFAITSYEQEQMKEDARTFADGILVYAYCSDETTALEGKTAALQKLATNSSSYSKIEQLESVNPVIAPENFVPVTTDPVLKDPTMAYAGSFTWEFSGVAADSSVTSESNPDGTFADKGYSFSLTFSQATDESTGDSSWMISRVDIQPK